MLSLPAWMRTRFDQFGKQMVRSAVAARGSVETDAEVPADTRRIDLWFMPDPACEPAPGYLGLLGRITAGPSTLEFFHNTPSGDDLADCLIKHGQFRALRAAWRVAFRAPVRVVAFTGQRWRRGRHDDFGHKRSAHVGTAHTATSIRNADADLHRSMQARY
jgi:hypothetical protein